MKDMLEGNQSGSSANSWLQRKHRQRSGKKETEQRKSATPGGVFPSLLFFLGFSPTQASRIFQQHVGPRRMIQKRNTGFAAHKQSHKYRFCGLEAEPGFKQKHSGEKKQHSKASFSVLSTWLKKHTEKAKRDTERERGRRWWGLDLPKVVQGIHVAEGVSPILRQRMKRGIKGRDYGGEGEVSAWEERAVHMLKQPFPFVFTSSKNLSLF